MIMNFIVFFFFFQAEDGIRDADVTGVQTCALPILRRPGIEARAEAEHVRAVRSGSVEDRASIADWRAPLRAPDRLLPAAADGAKPLPAHCRGVPGSGRPA